MLWVGLHLHRLALEVFERGLRASDGRGRRGHGLAVGDRLQVLLACDAALTRGVRPGMNRATALALAPGLQVVERDRMREREALGQLAAWAMQFTPAVSLQPPDGLLLEVERSLRLFGGLPSLLRRLRRGVTELGFEAACAVAPTPTAAWLLARADVSPKASGRVDRDAPRADPAEHGDTCPDDATQDGVQRATAWLDARLATLPVHLLDAARPHAEALQGIGVRTLADLLRLPRDGLARRFGEALLVEIDRARGVRPEPRAWFEAPAVFHARLDLLARVETAEALLFAARRLMLQMTGWLAARQAATAGCALSAEHDDRPDTRIALRLADASREADRFVTVLRERLVTVRLPAPAHALHLDCDEAVSLPADSAALFEHAPGSSEALARLVERLQARLGRGRVLRLRLADDHRPEFACRLEWNDALPEPASRSTGRGRGTGVACRAADPADHASLPQRPLWLLREPLALSQREGRPYHHGPLRLRGTPERIEAGWWESRLVQRDYYVAEGDDAVLYWVFRTRLAEQAPAAWFLHGLFG